jgi:hypothetical protein
VVVSRRFGVCYAPEGQLDKFYDIKLFLRILQVVRALAGSPSHAATGLVGCCCWRDGEMEYWSIGVME